MLWWMLLACGLFDLERGHDRHPEETWAARGVAARIPVDAKVRTEQGRLSVDGPNGGRWFDVAWVPANNPQIIAQEWAPTTCDPMSIVWDAPTEPAPNVWASGGLCTVNNIRHWAIVVVETRGDRALRTGYLADFHQLPFEDAYVDFIETAMTVNGGATPLPTPDNQAIRKIVRENAHKETGIKPIPGGGLLLTNVHPMFGDLFAAKRQSLPPALR